MESADHPGSRPRGASARKPAAILPESDERRVIVLVSVLELPLRKRKQAIAATLAGLACGVTPVFVTDSLDFGDFVRQRLYYEYFPALDRQSEHTSFGRWDAYLVKRLRIILDKWSPVRVMSPGTAIEAFVEKAGQ